MCSVLQLDLLITWHFKGGNAKEKPLMHKERNKELLRSRQTPKSTVLWHSVSSRQDCLFILTHWRVFPHASMLFG